VQRALLDKLTVAQVVRKLPAVYVTLIRFITGFTTALNDPLPLDIRIQYTLATPIHLRSILILSSHLPYISRLIFFPSGFPTKPCMNLIISYVIHTLPHLPWPDVYLLRLKDNVKPFTQLKIVWIGYTSLSDILQLMSFIPCLNLRIKYKESVNILSCLYWGIGCLPVYKARDPKNHIAFRGFKRSREHWLDPLK
jgi:hypothetical protein